MTRHQKIHGYVLEVHPTTWWAMLRDADGIDYVAEMSLPLPDDRREEGYIFTVHRTKRGRTYIFWPPPLPVSRNRQKRYRREARRLYKELCGDAA